LRVVSDDPPVLPDEWLLDESLMGTPIATRTVGSGVLTVYQSTVVGHYYTENTIALNAATQIYLPSLTTLFASSGGTVPLVGGTGYVFGFMAYTYKDSNGADLPVPSFAVAYEMLTSTGAPILVGSGLTSTQVVGPTTGGQQAATTATHSATGLHALWYMIPNQLGTAPDFVGRTQRKLKATVGISGTMTVSSTAISNGLVTAQSADFLCVDDTRNHMVELRKKPTGAYYQIGETVDINNPGTTEWVTPSQANSILGTTLVPETLPTGQEYYDAYRLPISQWQADANDMTGVTSSMSPTAAANLVAQNKDAREIGALPNSHVSSSIFTNFWKGLFGGGGSGGSGGGGYPYGGNTNTAIGPTGFSSLGIQCFDRGHVLIAKLYKMQPWPWLSLPIPGDWWPLDWHHAAVIDSNITNNANYYQAMTIEALGPGYGVQRIPYPRFWVYNTALRAIRCRYNQPLWNASNRATLQNQLSYWWNGRVGNPYDLFCGKYNWNKNYCSQLVWLGFKQGAWAAYGFTDDVDVNGGTFVLPTDVNSHANMKLWWYWP
jgi:hypothetical protein